jgi:branched-chain amino acid transport system ATP-binding protein
VTPLELPVAVPAVELVDVHASYGKIEVLRGVSIKVIDGRHEPSSGCVHIAGQHLNGTASDRLARAGVCSIPEGRGIFPNLTVEENLRLLTYSSKGLSQSEVQERAYARFPILGDRRRQVAGTLSGGQQQMLAVARAVVSDPALLIVDELSMGLAPLVVAGLYEVLGRLAVEGMTILMVEQFARTALALADYAAVMAHGSIQAVGEPADLEDMAGAYLGATA